MKYFKFMAAVVFLLVMFLHGNVMALWIDNVEVIPQQPSAMDSIILNVYGRADTWPSWVTHELFSQSGSTLQLDLYVDSGIQAAISQWSYSKEIGSLSPSTYNLEVRAFYENGILQDSYDTSFTVTPEPCTLALLGLGLPFIRTFSKRK